MIPNNNLAKEVGAIEGMHNEVGETRTKSDFAFDAKTMEKLDAKISLDNTKLLPRNGGEWTGERGDSEWRPDKNIEPGDRNGTNPEHKTWGEIQNEYNFQDIPFKDGYPDFSELAKGEVKINDFTDERDLNFAQADEKWADLQNKQPEDIAKWRQENGYTWHECPDCQTMQLLPSEVHGNIPHSGGISVYKVQHLAA